MSWDDFNVAVEADHYNIYRYNMTSGELAYIDQPVNKTFNVSGLSSGTEYSFVITTVASSGNESYHTDIASATTF